MIAGNLQQIGERLKVERARLGLSQAAIADACAVNRGTLASWEKGEQSPTAAVLAVMACLGVDVLYVVTGERGAEGESTLAPAERALLSSYARADQAGRAALEAVAVVAGRDAGAGTQLRSAVHIGGDVGQTVDGNATFNAPLSITMTKKGR